MPLRPRHVLVLGLAAGLWVPAAHAQTAPPRIGAGFDAWGAPPSQDLVPEGVALGLRGRAALPLNADVSVAASLGIGAHLWQGAANARWVANPQTELIVTFPGRNGTIRYVLGGFGGFLPFDGPGGAPTLHVGAGTAIPLNDTSLFLEVNPSLLVGESETTAVLAARAGVIF